MNTSNYSARTYWHEGTESGAVKDARSGGIPYRITIDTSECACPVLLRDVFDISTKAGSFLSRLFKLFHMQAFNGPLSAAYSEKNIEQWIEYAEGIAKKMSMVKLSATPPLYLFQDNPELKTIFDNAFGKAGFDKVKMHTVVLDIRKGKDAAFKMLKSETRRKVRRSLEANLEISQTCDPEHVKKWQKIKNRNDDATYRFLTSADNYDSNNFDFLVATLDGEPMAWQAVRWGKDVAILEGNALAPEARYNKTFANYALQWFVIEQAVERGIKWIDWVGAEPESEDPKMQNIMKFKLSWGGKLVEYFIYEKTTCKSKDMLIKFLRWGQGMAKNILSAVKRTVKNLNPKKVES